MRKNLTMSLETDILDAIKKKALRKRLSQSRYVEITLRKVFKLE